MTTSIRRHTILKDLQVITVFTEIVLTMTFEEKEKHGLRGRKDRLSAGEMAGQRMVFGWRRGSYSQIK